MKCLKIILVLGFILLSLSFIQLNSVKSKVTPQILSSTTLDLWGNTDDFVYRGEQSDLVLVINSPESGTYKVYVTLIDANNVPVAIATTGNIQLNGNGVVTLKLQVASSAFVGLGKYFIVVTDQNYQSVASLITPVYIGILGDLNLDGTVNFQDLVTFSTAYAYYNQYHAIPSDYKICDINGDDKIEFMDLVIFASAYASYWHN